MKTGRGPPLMRGVPDATRRYRERWYRCPFRPLKALAEPSNSDSRLLSCEARSVLFTPPVCGTWLLQPQDSIQVGMGVMVWGNWSFQGLGGGLGPFQNPVPPTVTVQACGRAGLLLSPPAPRPHQQKCTGTSRAGLHLEALAGGFQFVPFPVSRDPSSGGPVGRPWQGNRDCAVASGQGGVAPFMARDPGRRQQVLQ